MRFTSICGSYRGWWLIILVDFIQGKTKDTRLVVLTISNIYLWFYQGFWSPTPNNPNTPHPHTHNTNYRFWAKVCVIPRNKSQTISLSPLLDLLWHYAFIFLRNISCSSQFFNKTIPQCINNVCPWIIPSQGTLI